MPHFCVDFKPAQAGCVERLCMFTPWHQPMRDNTGKVMNPWEMAFGWLQQYANQRDANGNPILALPPGAQVTASVLNTGGAGTTPLVYCTQTSYPDAGRAQVNAPYAGTFQNGRGMAPPPMQQPANAPRTTPQGAYEDLTDAGLGVIGDVVFGEGDESQRTFTDIDGQGRETVRQMYQQPSAPVAGR